MNLIPSKIMFSGVNWGEWTGLSTCSVTCGTGVQTRQRICAVTQQVSTAQVCIGDAIQYYQCSLQACSTGEFGSQITRLEIIIFR